jgi:hypothetical protein
MNRFISASPSCRLNSTYFNAFHPQLRARCPPTTFRRPTSTVGTDKTGFIDKATGESLLYFDSWYPPPVFAYKL